MVTTNAIVETNLDLVKAYILRLDASPVAVMKLLPGNFNSLRKAGADVVAFVVGLHAVKVVNGRRNASSRVVCRASFSKPGIFTRCSVSCNVTYCFVKHESS
jgi:hypothetical protein